MPVNSSKYVPQKDGLAARASRSGPSKSALMAAASPANTPDSNTGCSLRHGVDNTGKNETPVNSGAAGVPQTTPPPKKARSSRARKTSPCLEAWLDHWFFDWLSITIPNSKNGKGERRGTNAVEYAEANAINDPEERKRALEAYGDEAEVGRREDRDGCDTLCLWAVSQDLHYTRVGTAPNGYGGGLTYGADPVSTECLALVQSGHKRNMPGLIIPGGNGVCSLLAPKALRLLGPVLLARADVSWDWSQEGYFDALLAYAQAASKRASMAAPRLLVSDSGRTFYWGNSEGTSVTVYEKDLERVAKSRLAPEDADPNLVRVEFRIAPEVADKAGMAMIARDHGPGALLGTSLWVRTMVEHIGEITGVTEKGATMAVTRVEKAPDPRTCADRAAYGLTQYAGTLCSAVVSQIVQDKHAGDWRAAEISSEEIREGVMELVASFMQGTGAAEAAVSRLGVDRARSIEAEALRGSRDLQEWIRRQEEDRDRAQSELLDAAMVAAMRVGVPTADEGRETESAACADAVKTCG